MKRSISITDVIRVQPKSVSEFSTKDYYLRVTCGLNGRLGVGRTAEKNLFFDNPNHRALFKVLEKQAIEEFGKEYEDELVETKDLRKTERFEFKKSIEYYGHMPNFKLPNGKLLARKNSKSGENISSSINFVCIGEEPEFDTNGNIASAGWGETAYDEWTRFEQAVRDGALPGTRIIEDNTHGGENANDFEDELDETPEPDKKEETRESSRRNR